MRILTTHIVVDISNDFWKSQPITISWMLALKRYGLRESIELIKMNKNKQVKTNKKKEKANVNKTCFLVCINSYSKIQ